MLRILQLINEHNESENNENKVFYLCPLYGVWSMESSCRVVNTSNNRSTTKVYTA